MAIPSFLVAVEQTGVSTSIREAPYGFYFILTIHTIGLSLLVGPNVVIDLRLLGIARQIPLVPMKRLFGLMWLGLGFNAVSGILLALAYPIKAFTNPVFYIKLTLIGVAVLIMYMIKTRVLDDLSLSEADMMRRGRALAVWSIVFWSCAMAAGRLLAYTCSYLISGLPC